MAIHPVKGMAFGGDVDTLSLTFDKLQYIFNGYGQIRDIFLEASAGYKEGRVPEGEFYGKVLEAVLRFSALEFLAIKSLFEIKKALGRGSGSAGTTVDGVGLPDMTPPQIHSLASFITDGALPKPEEGGRPGLKTCTTCGNRLKSAASYCTRCGAKF